MNPTITLRFLGCGDAFGSGGQAQTCFYLQTASLNIMVDCGATSLVQLKAAGLTTDDIDVIALTHFHGDHYGGVPFILLDAALVRKRTTPLTIVSPPGGRQRITQLLNDLYPGTEEKVMKPLDLRFYEFSGEDSLSINGLFDMHTFPVVHSPESLPHGFRITLGDNTVAFSGDTSWTDVLPDLSADADLFVCECNFFDTEMSQHLHYTQLEEKSGLFTAKRMILNHLGEEMLQNLDKVSIPVAEDNEEIVF